MGTIGAFGEISENKKTEQDICDFGEPCAEKKPVNDLRFRRGLRGKKARRKNLWFR